MQDQRVVFQSTGRVTTIKVESERSLFVLDSLRPRASVSNKNVITISLATGQTLAYIYTHDIFIRNTYSNKYIHI